MRLFILLALVSCGMNCPESKRIYKEVNYSMPIPDAGWMVHYKDGSLRLSLIPKFNGDMDYWGCKQ